MSRFCHSEKIKNRFKKFQKNEKIASKGIPVLKSPKKKQQASQVANWWNEVEQLSLEQALEYSFLFSRIYDFAKKFPNSGSLQALLMEYNKNLKLYHLDRIILLIFIEINKKSCRKCT